MIYIGINITKGDVVWTSSKLCRSSCCIWSNKIPCLFITDHNVTLSTSLSGDCASAPIALSTRPAYGHFSWRSCLTLTTTLTWRFGVDAIVAGMYSIVSFLVLPAFCLCCLTRVRITKTEKSRKQSPNCVFWYTKQWLMWFGVCIIYQSYIVHQRLSLMSPLRAHPRAWAPPDPDAVAAGSSAGSQTTQTWATSRPPAD